MIRLTEINSEIFKLNNQIIDLIKERDLLIGDIISVPLNKHDIIIKVVSETTGVSIDFIKAKDRHRHIVEARHITSVLLKKYTKYSLSMIGQILGLKDHATVIHAINKHEDRLCINDKKYIELYEQCENNLNKIIQ